MSSRKGSSRLIIKNLPKYLTDQKFRDVFTDFGEVTDVKIMKTADGRSRRFGFVGFRSEKEARAARDHFDSTYIDTAKISVEFALPVGSADIPRPWSKHTKGGPDGKEDPKSKQDQQANGKKGAADEKSASESEGKGKKRKRDQVDEGNNAENDPEFEEFLSVANKKTKFWANDDGMNAGKKKEKVVAKEKKEEEKVVKVVKEVPNLKPGGQNLTVKRTHLTFGDDNESDDEEYQDMPGKNPQHDDAMDAEDEKDNEEDKKPKDAVLDNPEVSDLDYLKSRMKSNFDFSKFDSDDENEDQKETNGEDNMEEDGDNTDNKKEDEGVSFNNGKQTNNAEEDDDPDLNKKKMKTVLTPEELQEVGENGRLFVRNLPFSVTEDNIYKLFSKYGQISEVHVPINKETKQSRGIAYVLYLVPQDAVKAITSLDGTIFQGRLLHILPAKENTQKEVKDDEDAQFYRTQFQKKKTEKMQNLAQNDVNWNTLFMRADAVADSMAAQYGVEKSDIFDPEAGNVAVRLTLGETHAINRTKKWLAKQGVSLDAMRGHYNKAIERSKTVILVKNIPFNSEESELNTMFSKFGSVNKVILPPTKTIALVEFLEPSEARKAFKSLAYRLYQGAPLFLEWAPVGIMSGSGKQQISGEEDDEVEEEEVVEKKPTKPAKTASKKADETKEEEKSASVQDDMEEEDTTSASLYVKNLNFNTTEETLRNTFMAFGRLRSVKIAQGVKDGQKTSLGYGFVEFHKRDDALNAFKKLQGKLIDDHNIAIKFTQNKKKEDGAAKRKAAEKVKPSAKLLVRNVAFEANKKEIRELFSAFGELKSVRLPVKQGGKGHRGFAFVEFLTEEEAKAAREALSNSHFYGRHLVIEYSKEGENVEDLREKTKKLFSDLDKK